MSSRSPIFIGFILLISLTACAPVAVPTNETIPPEIDNLSRDIPPGFAYADGSRLLTFPADFGSHPDFRTEWWYYTGNLQTPDKRPFGFELTIFRVGLLPPTNDLPSDSDWYDRNLYFAHFAVSDIAANEFHAFERYSRPGPGLAGAQGDPYRVWIEDWSVSETAPEMYHLIAEEDGISIDLSLTDEMGVILHGEEGYSRKGDQITNASYYYSQPRLRAEGFLELNDARYKVSGLVWKDHEFSTSVLDANQIGWNWFSLQFEDGSALMLFQLRESTGGISDSSSGTFIHADGSSLPLKKDDFTITVLNDWRSPHTGGMYPAGWRIQLDQPGCSLEIEPWMADQEIHFTAFTYWEGAVRFEGECDGTPVQGNGYIELTGYAGNLPLP